MTGGASVSSVKAALGSALATISGLRTYDRQPDQLNPPFCWPTLEQVEYHGAMGPGLVTQTYTITTVVGRASERTSERLLDTYMSYGSGGVRYAIEADVTLGGVAQTSIVEQAGPIRTIEGNDNTTYLATEFRVVVYA
ncbi:MAG TPA: hypothetical protein VIG24_04675 [Acidimicrobiia bacterium]